MDVLTATIVWHCNTTGADLIETGMDKNAPAAALHTCMRHLLRQVKAGETQVWYAELPDCPPRFDGKS